MEKEFTFEKKETYTHEDVLGILKGHKGYLKVDELKEANGKLATELKPYKAKARGEHIASLLPENGDTDKIADILILAQIKDEDDDEAIKAKLSNTISNREYLQKPKVNDIRGVKVEKKVKEKPTKQPEKKYRFVK